MYYSISTFIYKRKMHSKLCEVSFLISIFDILILKSYSSFMALVAIKCFSFSMLQVNPELKGKAIRTLAIAVVATGLCYQVC